MNPKDYGKWTWRVQVWPPNEGDLIGVWELGWKPPQYMEISYHFLDGKLYARQEEFFEPQRMK